MLGNETNLRVAATLGAILGAAAVAVTAHIAAPDPAPVCHEDEVAVAVLPGGGEDYIGGMPSTHCIPLDDLIDHWTDQ